VKCLEILYSYLEKSWKSQGILFRRTCGNPEKVCWFGVLQTANRCGQSTQVCCHSLSDVNILQFLLQEGIHVTCFIVHYVVGSDLFFFYWLLSVFSCQPCLLVHSQVTIIFVVSVCLFVCAEFFSAVFDPILIKLGHMLCLGLVVSRKI